jgi:hypothetical protein
MKPAAPVTRTGPCICARCCVVRTGQCGAVLYARRVWICAIYNDPSDKSSRRSGIGGFCVGLRASWTTLVRNAGPATLAVRRGAPAVVGCRGPPAWRRLSRADQPRRQAGSPAASRPLDRAPGDRLLRGRQARLERPVAARGEARTRWESTDCRTFDFL